MTLPDLIGRKRLVVLGINSGTSADGLDLAAVRVSRTADGVHTTYLEGTTRRYGPSLRQLVFNMADHKVSTLDAVIHLDSLLGQFMAQSGQRLLDSLARRRIKVDMIASHGQTVRHSPAPRRLGRYRVRGTLQLGSIDHLAAATGRVVVGDFRQADVAGGGEGAPITTGAMHRLFAGERSRIIVNIGGMANYFYLPGRRSTAAGKARDCGPGNCLSDTLAQMLYGQAYDKHGSLAARGRISHRLLQQCLKEKFYSKHSISTGREDFGPSLARKIIATKSRLGLTDPDVMATTCELTAVSIARALLPVIKRDRTLKKLYLTGGGRHNMFLRKRIAEHLPALTVGLIDDLGIPGDLVEAAAFAVLGEACVRSEPLLPATARSRAKSVRPILGRIAQPPHG